MLKIIKFSGLGLGMLLTSQMPCVLGQFADIMHNIIEILHDVMKCDDNGTYSE